MTNFDMRRIYFCSFLSSLPYLKRVSCNRIATLRVLIWKTEFFLGIHSHLHFDNENHEEKKTTKLYQSIKVSYQRENFTCFRSNYYM